MLRERNPCTIWLALGLRDARRAARCACRSLCVLVPCAVCVSVKCTPVGWLTPDITRADETCLLWSGPSENCRIHVVVGNDQPCADPACISPDTLTSAAAQSGFNFATTSAMLGRVDACRARTAATRGVQAGRRGWGTNYRASGA